MINVFEYTDYRKYLVDYYEDKKRENHRFSYQIIANKAGIKNRGFIFNIINGKKSLLKSNVFKLCRALGLNQHETEYFEDCVAFTQADDIRERTYLFQKMSAVKNRGKPTSKAQVLRRDQYEFYSKWYHVMLRAVIGMCEFKGDFRWLSKTVDPPITVPQAKHSVRLLLDLGLIRREKSGVYTVSDPGLTTGKDVMSVAFQNFHLACTELAKRSFTEYPLNERNMTGLTLGISEKSYRSICGEINKFQETLMDIANADDEADRVYQLNFHFFPTSRRFPERRRA
jgi:uncharacterized protein (TIGR02147 family)